MKGCKARSRAQPQLQKISWFLQTYTSSYSKHLSKENVFKKVFSRCKASQRDVQIMRSSSPHVCALPYFSKPHELLAMQKR